MLVLNDNKSFKIGRFTFLAEELRLTAPDETLALTQRESELLPANLNCLRLSQPAHDPFGHLSAHLLPIINVNGFAHSSVASPAGNDPFAR